MTSGKSVISYRGWTVSPLAIPVAGGNWHGTCEIRKIDGTSSDATLYTLGNVVRSTKEDAIAEICEQARREIDSTFALPY